MAVCSKRGRHRLEGERRTRDVEYVWRMWRTLYTHPGSVMGAFRLLVCNIRNSCLPVCRLLPRARDVPIGASETRTRARCESGITCVSAEFEGRTQGRISPTFRKIKLFCTTKKKKIALLIREIYYHRLNYHRLYLGYRKIFISFSVKKTYVAYNVINRPQCINNIFSMHVKHNNCLFNILLDVKLYN